MDSLITLTIPRPDDWHVHLREGAMLKAVLPYTARLFGRAIVMPNLKSPVTTTAKAQAYREAILAALPEGSTFKPLMTVYLTDQTDPDDLVRGHQEGILTAAKLYPANATTNSEFGVTDIQILRPVFYRMQSLGLPLLLHGEVTDPAVDIFDREAIFIEKVLGPLRRDFPELKIVLEHVTTREGVDYVFEEGEKGRLAATITAHHLRINRNALFVGGIRPHHYCLPVAKREEHRLALIRAAASGKRMFFLGTDSAPHPRAAKESPCGCAGIFTAFNALSLYAQTFFEFGALDRLSAFASLNGPAFYGLPISKEVVWLERSPQPVSDLKPILTTDGAEIMPFHDAASLCWRVTSNQEQ